MKKLLTAIFFLVAILSIVVAFAHDKNAHTIVAELEPEMVLTPLGPRRKSSAVLVPKNASLLFTGDEIQVVHKNGTILHHTARFPVAAPVPGPAFATGYVAYAYYSIPEFTLVKSFSTTWEVPPNPTTDHGQTVFLFNGLVPDDFSSILQPVLQWGPSAAREGANWQVASWFVSNAHTYFSPLVPVTVGQTLTGVMSIDMENHRYASYFTDISQSNLIIGNGPQLTWAYEALEAYNVQEKSDYPTGTTTFTKIELVGPSSVSWMAKGTPTDGLSCNIIRNSGVNGEIEVHYT